ncbi:MAG: MBL fold metallo-hydrolase, partial [Planctomycetota bacterium]
ATSIGHAGIFIETRQGTILCDPWFNPAFFGSWFVFPRNDQLPHPLRDEILHPSFLYISHLHGDHFDEKWLSENIPRHTPVLLPDFPTNELERRLRSLGFDTFVRTRTEADLRAALEVVYPPHRAQERAADVSSLSASAQDVRSCGIGPSSGSGDRASVS